MIVVTKMIIVLDALSDVSGKAKSALPALGNMHAT
jgi:hypothetical protein